MDSANPQGHPICGEWKGFPYSQRYTLLFYLVAISHCPPVASDGKLEETFTVNSPDGRLQPEAETGEQVPLSPPLTIPGENADPPKAGNRIHRSAGHSEHEEVPHGQRQGPGIVYKHGVLHRDPGSEGEGKVSRR